MYPLVVAVGTAPSNQILHIADNAGALVNLGVQSVRMNGDDMCSSFGSPQLTNNLLPVTATFQLQTLGSAPFRVVRTP